MRPLLALLLIAAPVVAAPVPKGLKRAAPLDGRWRLESQVADGVAAELSEDRDEWTVSGTTLAIGQRGRRGEMRVTRATLESAPQAGGPRTFGYKVLTNTYHRRGVCELDGDTLRVAFRMTPDKPPAGVTAGEGVVVYTFRRMTDTK